MPPMLHDKPIMTFPDSEAAKRFEYVMGEKFGDFLTDLVRNDEIGTLHAMKDAGIKPSVPLLEAIGAAAQRADPSSTEWGTLAQQWLHGLPQDERDGLELKVLVRATVANAEASVAALSCLLANGMDLALLRPAVNSNGEPMSGATIDDNQRIRIAALNARGALMVHIGSNPAFNEDYFRRRSKEDIDALLSPQSRFGAVRALHQIGMPKNMALEPACRIDFRGGINFRGEDLSMLELALFRGSTAGVELVCRHTEDKYELTRHINKVLAGARNIFSGSRDILSNRRQMALIAMMSHSDGISDTAIKRYMGKNSGFAYMSKGDLWVSPEESTLIHVLANAGCNDRNDALMAPHYHARAIAAVVASGAIALDVRDQSDRTALHDVGRRGDGQLFAELVSIGMDMNTKDKSNRTPLSYLKSASADGYAYVSAFLAQREVEKTQQLEFPGLRPL